MILFIHKDGLSGERTRLSFAALLDQELDILSLREDSFMVRDTYDIVGIVGR